MQAQLDNRGNGFEISNITLNCLNILNPSPRAMSSCSCPTTNYKQKYHDLLSKYSSLQSELHLLKQQQQLRHCTLTQHIQFLQLDNKSRKEQLERIQQKHRFDLQQVVKRAEEEFRHTHEAVVQIYKSQQERLQQLVKGLSEKLERQAEMHERVVREYKGRIERLYVEGFRGGRKVGKENSEETGTGKKSGEVMESSKSTMTLLEIYRECLGNM